MSIKHKRSFISIPVSSEESQKGNEILQDKSNDTVEAESYDALKGPNHKLSLKFLCSDTSADQRKLCEGFWKVIDQHPELDRIMARGWSESEVVSKAKPTKKKAPPPTHCDELQEFLNHNVDKSVLLGWKSFNDECSTEREVLDLSSAHLYKGLQDFDSKVHTENSIPPKTPRPTRSQQDMLYIQHASSVELKSNQEIEDFEGDSPSKNSL